MKQFYVLIPICLFYASMCGQTASTNSPKSWAHSFQKFYVEADAGALFIFSFGASADLGYQFHPALGLGITASGYSELDDYFPASWSGWGCTTGLLTRD
jgi:hypothetical protein